MQGRGFVKIKYPWLWLLTLILILLDRYTKVVIVNSSDLPIDVIPGFFSIVRVTNTGIAFGIFSSVSSSIMNPLLSAVALVVVVALAYMLLFKDDIFPIRFSMHLLIAGAVGNSWDRLAYGKVIDFLDFSIAGRHWPSFNVADASITVGLVIILIFTLFFTGKKSDVSKTD